MGLKKKKESGDNVPLSFYFDLSRSMDCHIRILAIMALRILRKGVKVIVGFNQNAYIQIDEIPKNCSVKEFSIFMNNMKSFSLDNYETHVMKKTGIKIKKLNYEYFDEYLIRNNAEKVVVFSDFDPKSHIENLSKKCKVYWFCFYIFGWLKEDLDEYKGQFFRTRSENDIIKHLKKMDSKSYSDMQRRSGEFIYSGNYYTNQDYRGKKGRAKSVYQEDLDFLNRKFGERNDDDDERYY